MVTYPNISAPLLPKLCNLRSFLEVVFQQLQGMCVHVGGADGGSIAYGLGGVHIGAVGAVILAVHSLHGFLHPAALDDAVSLQVVDQVIIGLPCRDQQGRRSLSRCVIGADC